MRESSIRRRILLVFLFGVVAPVILAGWFSHWVAAHILTEQAIESQRRLLGDLSRSLWTLQQSSHRQLALLAETPATVAAANRGASVPEELFRTFLRLNPEWRALILFDRVGAVVWVSDADVPWLGDDELFALFFAAATARRIQTPVAETEDSRVTRVAVEVTRAGELAGVLAAVLDLGFLDPYLARARVSDDLGVLLWDDRGVVFASNLDSRELAELREHLALASGERDRRLATFELRHRTVRLDGESHLFSVQRIPEQIYGLEPIPGDTWFMGLAVPRGHAFASLRRFQLALGAGVAFALLGAAGVLLWIGRSVAHPLERMVAFAESIGTGERGVRLRDERDDEVGRLARALNRMVDSLERSERELIRQESLAVMGRMSALVAHEIRNPLNAMKGSVQLLQMRAPDDAVLQEHAALLLDRIHHLARFVEQLLTTARLPAPRLTATTVGEIVEAAWNPLHDEAERRGVTLEIDGPEVELEVDRQQLVELVHNLARNAVEAMEEGGVFEVRAEEHGEAAVITFRDDGPGIAPEIRERLFHPFTSTKRQGTGLGLVFCRMVAENHAGSLEFLAGDAGARFRLVLPASPPRDGR